MGIGYPRTSAEIAAGVTPVDYSYDWGNVKRYGASSSNTNAQNKAALQLAISSASVFDPVVIVPSDISYGYVRTDITTHPDFSSTTVPVIVYDYGPGNSYAGFPTTYDGAQVRLFMNTPPTPRSFTFSSGLSSGATSGTLSTDWTHNSSAGTISAVWAVTFSTGDVRQVTLTNNARTATWSTGLSSNVTQTASYNDTFHDGNGHKIFGAWAPYHTIDNVSGLPPLSTGGIDNRRALQSFSADGNDLWSVGQGTRSGAGLTVDQLANFAITCYPTDSKPLTFTAGLAGGATSGTLAAPFADQTGSYTAQFFDAITGLLRDSRVVSLTTGSTSVTWSGGLSGAVLAANNYFALGSAIQNAYVPILIERATGNIGFGVGTNTPQASYWFTSVSTGFAQGYFENPFTTTCSVYLRTSNGGTDDAGIINRAGQLCLNISTQGDAISFDKANRRATFGSAYQAVQSTITYAASMTPDATVGNVFVIAANNGTAFSIGAPSGSPTQAMQITIRIKNSSGGALGAATWDSHYKMAAWTQPAAGFSRSIIFTYEVATGFWIETSRTTVDIPN
jgi:hypothetical protein